MEIKGIDKIPNGEFNPTPRYTIMLPTKENIENQFREKYVGNETFPKRISDPILADDIIDFILQIQKETIEAIRLKEAKESPYVHAEWAQKKYPTGEITKTNLHRKGYNQAVSEQQSLIKKLL